MEHYFQANDQTITYMKSRNHVLIRLVGIYSFEIHIRLTLHNIKPLRLLKKKGLEGG